MVASDLTNVINGCTFVTNESQRHRKGGASQPCARVASSVRRIAGRSRTSGQAVLDLSTTSLSLSATRPAAETAGSGGRIQNGIYGQTSGEFNRTDKVVCRPERAVVERCGESRVARFVRTRARAWVSRSRFGDALWSWNTDLIVCWKRSWLRSTRCWFLRIAIESEQHSRKRQS